MKLIELLDKQAKETSEMKNKYSLSEYTNRKGIHAGIMLCIAELNKPES